MISVNILPIFAEHLGENKLVSMNLNFFIFPAEFLEFRSLVQNQMVTGALGQAVMSAAVHSGSLNRKWFSIRFIQKRRRWRCSVKKGVIRNFAKFTGKHLCQKLFFKKESLAQVFSSEFCEISKNTFFTEHVWTTASVFIMKYFKVQDVDKVVSKFNSNSHSYICVYNKFQIFPEFK